MKTFWIKREIINNIKHIKKDVEKLQLDDDPSRKDKLIMHIESEIESFVSQIIDF